MSSGVILNSGVYRYAEKTYDDRYLKHDGVDFFIYALVVSKKKPKLEGFKAVGRKAPIPSEVSRELTEEQKEFVDKHKSRGHVWFLKIEGEGWDWASAGGASGASKVQDALNYLRKFKNKDRVGGVEAVYIEINSKARPKSRQKDEKQKEASMQKTADHETKDAVSDVVRDHIQDLVDSTFGRLIVDNPDDYLVEQFEQNLEAWVDLIADEIYKAEYVRGDGDITAIDASGLPAELANILVKMGAGTREELMELLQDWSSYEPMIEAAFEEAAIGAKRSLQQEDIGAPEGYDYGLEDRGYNPRGYQASTKDAAGNYYHKASATVPPQVAEVVEEFSKGVLAGTIVLDQEKDYVHPFDKGQTKEQIMEGHIYFAAGVCYVRQALIEEISPEPVWTISDNYERLFSTTFVYDPSGDQWYSLSKRQGLKPRELRNVLANAPMIYMDLGREEMDEALQSEPQAVEELKRAVAKKMSEVRDEVVKYDPIVPYADYY